MEESRVFRIVVENFSQDLSNDTCNVLTEILIRSVQKGSIFCAARQKANSNEESSRKNEFCGVACDAKLNRLCEFCELTSLLTKLQSNSVNESLMGDFSNGFSLCFEQLNGNRWLNAHKILDNNKLIIEMLTPWINALPHLYRWNLKHSMILFEFIFQVIFGDCVSEIELSRAYLLIPFISELWINGKCSREEFCVFFGSFVIAVCCRESYESSKSTKCVNPKLIRILLEHHLIKPMFDVVISDQNDFDMLYLKDSMEGTIACAFLCLFQEDEIVEHFREITTLDSLLANCEFQYAKGFILIALVSRLGSKLRQELSIENIADRCSAFEGIEELAAARSDIDVFGLIGYKLSHVIENFTGANIDGSASQKLAVKTILDTFRLLIAAKLMGASDAEALATAIVNAIGTLLIKFDTHRFEDFPMHLELGRLLLLAATDKDDMLPYILTLSLPAKYLRKCRTKEEEIIAVKLLLMHN